MVSYNLDRFRDFVFGSRFLSMFEFDDVAVEKFKSDDVSLLRMGFDWLNFSLFGQKTMPLKDRPSPVISHSTGRAPSLAESSNDNAKIRVMAIDDDRITLKFVMACLGKDPAYEVIASDHGQKALEMIKGDPPDILVTDWMMPDLDGLELCRLVRSLDYKNYIYIILLTARTDHDDIVNGLEAGADDYMVKPFDQGELLARVRAGARVVAAQRALTEANEELQKALAQIKTLKGPPAHLHGLQKGKGRQGLLAGHSGLY